MDLAVNDLKKSLNRSGLKEVSSLQQCHFLLFFCPIISRAGTDIDAAVTYINQVIASSLPVIMVVLHYTFDEEKLTQDSNSVIKSEGISAVDCLFYENGLLTCQKNTNAINKIAKDLKSEKRTLYYCLKRKYSKLYILHYSEKFYFLQCDTVINNDKYKIIKAYDIIFCINCFLYFCRR
uniref:Uncharacterized protein n=1 Tax=Cyprinus carpio TaxID=7962 RepID=A0A8C2K6W8_CYPCA